MSNRRPTARTSRQEADAPLARRCARLERLLAIDPQNPGYRNLHAVVLSHVGEVERSCAIYERLLREYPSNAKVWLSYGHVLKTAGRQQDCIAAYRRCIALEAKLGEAYWSLANLKTFRFTAEDLATLRAHLADTSLSDIDRLNFHFALGKAHEDAGEAEFAFEHYERGNALQRKRLPYEGSMFGIVTWDAGHVMAFGLRGNVFESTDGGDTWSRLDTGAEVTLMGGSALPGGGVVIVGNEGVILERKDGASPLERREHQNARGETPVLSGAIPDADGTLILIGDKGVDRDGHG